MIKRTKFMNVHLTIFHIYHFVIGKLQTHFLPNNQNKAVPNYQTKSKNLFGRKKLNGPLTGTFGQ